MSGFKSGFAVTFAALALVGGLIWAIVQSNGEHNRWANWCASQGGHVTDHTETTTTVVVNPSNGQPAVGVGSSTTYYCLSADGRILDIR